MLFTSIAYRPTGRCLTLRRPWRFAVAAALATSLLVAGAAIGHAQVYVTAQFDWKASLEGKPGFGFEVSTHGTAHFSSPQLHTLHFNTNDWQILDNKLVNVTGKHAAGLRLEPDNGEYEAATIRAGCLLVRPNSLGSRVSLFCSATTIRTTSRLHGGANGVLDHLFASTGTRVWINQVENLPEQPALLPTNQWVLVSFILPTEIFLNGQAVDAIPGADSRVMLLGDGNPEEWGRTLDAEILAATLLGGSGPDSEFALVLRGIEHAAALRYGVKGVAKPAAAEARNAVWAANYRAFGVWGTLFLVR